MKPLLNWNLLFILGVASDVKVHDI